MVRYGTLPGCKLYNLLFNLVKYLATLQYRRYMILANIILFISRSRSILLNNLLASN